MGNIDEKITKKDARRIYASNHNRVLGDAADGFVVLKNVNKIYANNVQAVYDFNLAVRRNEFIVLVGPSGCGKSTTLRMIAGLEAISSGYLYINNVMANYLESKDRDIAMVFQSYALYPNMSVFENIAFGLRVRGMKNDEIKEKVFAAAEILDLGAYLDRKPRELSGGQMQRVALGRAIVRDAKLFLMDEPLSNLDAKLRVQMRSQIVKLHKDIQATTIYVTHDQTEAMTMADRIVIMNKGFIQQIGTPREIYDHPKNLFVATFIGNPPMNICSAQLTGGALTSGAHSIQLSKETVRKYNAFISEKTAFYQRLKEQADFTQETRLSQRAKQILKTGGKTAAADLAGQIDALTQDLTALAAQKEFLQPLSGLADGLKSDYSAGGFKNAKSSLRSVSAFLDGADGLLAGILKEADSARQSVKKEKREDAKDKKKRAGKHAQEAAQQLRADNLQKIDEYLTAYREMTEKTGKITIGIRPEDIHLYDEYQGNKSKPLTVTADFVELLGSEYCVYINVFGSKIIMKLDTNRTVSMGDEMRICFNMDKIKLFDQISGVNVLFAPNDGKEAEQK